MKKSEVLDKTKEFYRLEVFQVDLYLSQANSVKETHIKRSFERKAEIEKQHVDYFAQKIAELGSDVSTLSKSSFGAAGFITGKAAGIVGLDDRYKLGMATEGKAIDMYYKFIREASRDPGLKELTQQLWYFMIDEEHHQFWFKEQLSHLPSGGG